MTIERAIELQRAVYATLVDVLAPVPVSQVPLEEDRYVRMDGFVLVVDERFRNHDEAQHRFFVHAFDSLAQGTNSSLWVIERLVQADAALRQMVLPGATRPSLEEMQVSFPPRGDGKVDARAFTRYSISIGET